MKKIILILALFVIGKVHAQISETTTEDPKAPLFSLYFGAGYAFMDISDLNNRYQAAGYHLFSEIMPVFSAGTSLGFMNRMFVSFDFTLFAETVRSPNLVTTSISGSHTSLNFNYGILQNKTKTFLYPFAGIDISSLTLSLTDNSSAGMNFNSNLTSLTGQKTLFSTPVFFMNIGMGFDQQILKRKNKILLGLRTGYRLALTDIKWGADIYQVEDGPDIDLGRFYFSVVFSSAK